MNPLKPLMQFCEGLHDKTLSIRITINKLNLKFNLLKAISTY